MQQLRGQLAVPQRHRLPPPRWTGAGARQRHLACTVAAASPPPDPTGDDAAAAFHASALPRLRKTARLEPSFALSQEDAVVAQLKALQHNNFPTLDAGIETLYKFAGIDPFARSRYFGISLDLGQFERYRRIFYTDSYITLLNHTSYEFLSTMEVTESLWKARVAVENSYRKEGRVYEFTMERRLAGRWDGYWYCRSLIADNCESKTLYGIM